MAREVRRDQNLRAHFLLESIAADARLDPDAYLDEARVEGGGE